MENGAWHSLQQQPKKYYKTLIWRARSLLDISLLESSHI